MTWQWANDSPVWLRPRKTIYFLVRHLDEHGAMEYRRDKRGRLITYRTREQTVKIQDRLNYAEQQPGNTVEQGEGTRLE